MATTANWAQAVSDEPLLSAPGWECGGRGVVEGSGGSPLWILRKVVRSRTAPWVCLAGDLNLSGRRPYGFLPGSAVEVLFGGGSLLV